MSGIRIKISQAITGDGNSVFKQLQRNILLKQGHLKAQCFVVSKDFKYRTAITSPALQCKSIVTFDNA